MPLTLDLVRLEGQRGIYPKGTGGPLPARMAWGHPDLAAALAAARQRGISLVLSDCYRSAAASLARRQGLEAAGKTQLAKRPGESLHNWGLAIDIDVPQALTANGLRHKRDLDAALAACGLWCHRRDGARGAEDWHYNALASASAIAMGDAHILADAARWLASASPRSTSRAAEAKIQALYGAGMTLAPWEVRLALASLGYSPSAELTEVVREFQLDWDLTPDGIAGPKTQRLLAYLTAKRPAGAQ